MLVLQLAVGQHLLGHRKKAIDVARPHDVGAHREHGGLCDEVPSEAYADRSCW